MPPIRCFRRTLHTGIGLLAERQHARLKALFADDDHVEVEATWHIYQQLIAAYREPAGSDPCYTLDCDEPD